MTTPVVPPKGASVRKKRRDLTRQHVLEAAERVFARRGYDGARMQEVAAEAGLALATMYAAISSKEELYAAIHEARGRALLARAAAAAAGARSAREAIVTGVEAYVAFLAEHPDYLRIHLLESQPWALDPRFLCAEQQRQWREGLELTVSTFRAAIAEGSVRAGDADLYARLMIATHQVFLVDWVERGASEPVAALVARLREHLERAFFVPPER